MSTIDDRTENALSDTDLIKKFQASGDTYLFGQIFQRYLPFTYGICLKYLKSREESKDAVMQIFEKLQNDLKTHTPANFKAWLYVVSKNHCLMLIRKTKKNVEVSMSSIDHLSFMESYQELHHDGEDGILKDHEKLQECLEQLPEYQKQCIELFYLKMHCYKEIVELTDHDLKKVKSYIQNGKRNLKNCMEKKDG